MRALIMVPPSKFADIFVFTEPSALDSVAAKQGTPLKSAL